MNKLIRVIRNFLHDFLPAITPKPLRKNLLSCKQVTELLLEADKLDWKTKMKLQIHLFICQCCTDYKTQVEFVTIKSKKIYPSVLSDEEKDRAQKIQTEVLKRLKK